MRASVEGLLRLAWRAEGEGRPGLRDALLTLVVADGGGGDPVLAERCRRLLVARQPGHWFASDATLGRAMARPRVVRGLRLLRAIFPPARVERLLSTGDALRGPYRGRRTPLGLVLKELALAPDPAADRRRGDGPPLALPFPGTDTPAPDGSLAALYFALLMTTAALLHRALEPAAHDTKAA